ncbi:CLUMA_CG009825, isoform A [Clunio marinus]|uniref:CLUMA_CG009825, isoform A n=1 Tax=Clunio marinus TaxID=568069 RepID=A0A1J1I813_9DIPT|nr:CLUMA_CG009825, isoform A [Clunio marinus]
MQQFINFEMMETVESPNECSSMDNHIVANRMEMENNQANVEWTHLNENIWIKILEHLDVKSLLNASEACYTFNETISSSSKLLRKMNITLKFLPALPTDRGLAEIDDLIQKSSVLTRPYRNLTILSLDDNCLYEPRRKSEFINLEILFPEYSPPDVRVVEDFLLKFKKLKKLKLDVFEFNREYSSDRLSAVPFQLEVLSLSSVHWENLSFCEKFLKSQTNLKILKLTGISQWIRIGNRSALLCFNDILQHLLTKNPKLTSVEICSHNMWYRMHNQVYEFEYDSFFGNCNNLKDICGDLQEIKVLKNLELLNIITSPLLLGNIQTTNFPCLMTFKYKALLFGEAKSLECLTKFFKHNSQIKNVCLSIESLTIHEVVGLLMPLTFSLESLTIANFQLNVDEAQILVSNFSHLRRLESDLQLKQDVTDTLSNAGVIVAKVPVASNFAMFIDTYPIF